MSRTLRWAIGGAVITLAVVGAFVGVLALLVALFRVNELLGYGAAIALAGGVFGLLLLDITRDQERFEGRMRTRPYYPTDEGE